MPTCPHCGGINPDGSRFCNACGQTLDKAVRERREERKVVTVLFADLVGFTEASERLDPEDVRALLGRYHSRMRDEIVRLGGTVEKFIGDAVMALFGAPVAREDDPERAVRAGFAIRDWADEQAELGVRIGVNTGTALVTLDAGVAEGEGMAAGDVVNTAARLQGAAPVNGILVGETTYRATRDVIDYEEREPLSLKGKSSPVPVWQALAALSRIAGEPRTGAQLVGRDAELDMLRDALDRATQRQVPQLVTLVGEPGMGKSRLVHELSRIVDDSDDLMFWRQGRSTAYADGGTFWALADIVKAHCGILESDPQQDAARKLRAVVADLVEDEADRAWVEGELAPLAGLAPEDRLAGTDRDRAFAAWFRFIEALALRRPLVLVLEDLHWAGDALVEFTDQLLDWARDMPLLVVCTVRPEFIQRHPGWGGGKVNAVSVALQPLTAEETATLVDSLASASDISPDERAALLRQSGGNPLYAEEFVRLVQEHDGTGGSAAALPESVQGLIAARLDALGTGDKRLLQDAAVVGAVFWAGAVAAIGGIERSEAEERLGALERHEFVRRTRTPSMAGEAEYSFRHVLVRDVAYEQIPRAQRAERHISAAAWLEGLGRRDDQAETRAHHYLTALDLARRTGDESGKLAARAWPALRDAGDRAMSLAGFDSAQRYYEAALENCPPDDPERPRLMLRLGQAARATTEGAALDPLIEALDAFTARGDHEDAVRAATEISQILWFRGERDRAYEYAARATSLLSGLPHSEPMAATLLTRAGFHLVTGEFEEALELANRAAPIIERLDLQARRPRLLNLRGWARVASGDEGGLEDLEQAVETGLEPPFEHLHSSFENLRSAQYSLGRLDGASRTVAAHQASAERLGIESRRWLGVLRAADHFERGRWDESLALSEELLAGTPHVLDGPCRDVRAAILLGRGQVEAARRDIDEALRLAGVVKDGQVRAHALTAGAIMALADGRDSVAVSLMDELEGVPPLIFPLSFGWPTFADVAWLLMDLGLRDDLLERIEQVPIRSAWVDVARAIAAGEAAEAAGKLAEMGHLPNEAEASRRAADALAAAGRAEDADAHAKRERELRRLFGAPSLDRGE